MCCDQLSPALADSRFAPLSSWQVTIALRRMGRSRNASPMQRRFDAVLGIKEQTSRGQEHQQEPRSGMSRASDALKSARASRVLATKR